MESKYRVLEYDEVDEDYFMGKILVGPDDFECILGEPEDCNWYRDGSKVITELNRLLLLTQEEHE